MRIISSFFLITLALNFSFCPTYPRMVLFFSYNNDKTDALLDIRNLLEEDDFKILEYAPEDGFLFTDYKEYNWGTGRRLLAYVVHITDKIKITGMGKMDVPVSDLGKPNELQKIKEFDRLPYSVQKNTFLNIIESLENLGYKQLKERK
jgi:hypothetical protein